MHETEFRTAIFEFDVTLSKCVEGWYTACSQMLVDITGCILNMEWQVTLASFCVTRKINIFVIYTVLQEPPFDFMIFETRLLKVIKCAQVIVVRINNETAYNYSSKFGHRDPPVNVWIFVRHK